MTSLRDKLPLQKHDATIRRRAFRDLPEVLRKQLGSMGDYTGASVGKRDVHHLANSIAKNEPFTIILFGEPLAHEHCRRKKFVEITRHQIASELDEVVFENFGRELNCRMADYLRDHGDPEDVYLNRLVREYYPRAKRILQKHHPKVWERDWKAGKYTRPRTVIERQRRYDMPKPLCWAGTSLSQQFYFMRKTHTYARGCSSGSGSREVHSYFGLAFMELSTCISIPSYILVYDKDNLLRYVTQRNEFVLTPDLIGHNCDVPYRTIKQTMKNTLKAHPIRSADYTEISGVRIVR
jgi:hypothetical protein